MIILDLTIPCDDRVDAARSEKLAKFAKLVSAIKGQEAFNVTYQSIEIGSYRQRLNDGSECALRLLHNYFSSRISFDTFRSNLIHLVNNCSYEVSIRYNFKKSRNFLFQHSLISFSRQNSNFKEWPSIAI